MGVGRWVAVSGHHLPHVVSFMEVKEDRHDMFAAGKGISYVCLKPDELIQGTFVVTKATLEFTEDFIAVK